MLAVIGGSGLAVLSELKMTRRELMRTPYGEPSGPLVFGEVGGAPVLFLARHGMGHIHAPQRVNYRANIWALRDAGATAVLAVASVGGLDENCPPPALVVPDQLIDYTTERENTYYDGSDGAVVHIDFTQPYSAELRQRILAAARCMNEPVTDGGVYAATQGPRLETAAEVRRIARDGGTIVGMTGMPEAVLARELSLQYAHLCVVSNWAAGIKDSARIIPAEAMALALAQGMGRARRIITEVAQRFAEPVGACQP